ncbi:MAG TPA: response regulator [Opitutaceae bacterium]|jgi:signal transduction histidine kinase|nr:response regulator [Opitutaceae bacterium]
MPKILVIDDDDALRKALEVALQVFGYETAVATNGAEGIRKARELLPDLILCDVNMPGMDGRQVLQAVRNDPALSSRQIVLMTGNQEQNPQREGMNLGADDYLPKPFEISQLRTCVEARLRRAQTYRRLEDGMLRRHAELFGATLPHEFMTPLNGILGFAEILKEDFGRISKEEVTQMLTDIEACARRLHRTLMNYLLLVRVEHMADAERGAVATLLPPDQAANLVAGVAENVARKAGRLEDLHSAVLPVALNAYEPDLRLIIEHLVENAFAFSVAGRPVSISLQAEGGKPVMRVRDEGRGMTSEQIAQIGVFMQFERKQFEQQGLGIGLALVMRLLERQGATLRFESKPDEGTTAIVEFKPATGV